jgi:hypothetical protein
MRVPRVRDTGQFDRDLGLRLNRQCGAIDPINVTVWGLFAAAIPAHWVGLVWGVLALINVATAS